MDSRNLDKGRKFNVYRGIIKILVEFDSPWSHFLKGIRRRVLRIFFCLKAFVFKGFEALKIFLVLGGCMKL